MSMPSIGASTASDAHTFEPSPTHATRTPSVPEKRSRIVSASASAWHGCSSSVSAFTIGIDAASAHASTSDCANVRIAIASR